MKKIFIALLLILAISNISAQEKEKVQFKLYGQFRGDLFYDSRANVESVDGLFYQYPKDVNPDELGKDLNSSSTAGVYDLYSRIGLDVNGPKVWGADTRAKIEFDFRGSGTSYSIARLRHAYVALDWDKSTLLVGQTWNPLNADVAPKLLNLSSGSPFQPFGRAPQVKYNYSFTNVKLTVAAVWQSQYLSAGPVGKSQIYIKNSKVPEFYASADYKTSRWLVGAGIEMLSIVPRTESTVDNKIYKVSERVTTLSYELHAKYNYDNLFVAARSMIGSNLTHTSMLGGYGVKSIDLVTGEQKYSANRNSCTWVNVCYGKKWQPGVFFGYMKNLGTSDAVSKMYGSGNDVDQITSGSIDLSYNLPHWKIGMEYSLTTAWYGNLNHANGKVVNTHSVTNNRVVGTLIYSF